jgi:hypothetical protein
MTMSYELKWSEKEAIGRIAAAARGDEGDPALVATYINWPWRYQVAAIIDNFYISSFPISSATKQWRISVDNDGVITVESTPITSASSSFLLKSPNGSIYSITIDDDGIITTAPNVPAYAKDWIKVKSPNNSIYLIKVDNDGIMMTEKQ